MKKVTHCAICVEKLSQNLAPYITKKGEYPYVFQLVQQSVLSYASHSVPQLIAVHKHRISPWPDGTYRRNRPYGSDGTARSYRSCRSARRAGSNRRNGRSRSTRSCRSARRNRRNGSNGSSRSARSYRSCRACRSARRNGGNGGNWCNWCSRSTRSYWSCRACRSAGRAGHTCRCGRFVRKRRNASRAHKLGDSHHANRNHAHNHNDGWRQRNHSAPRHVSRHLRRKRNG